MKTWQIYLVIAAVALAGLGILFMIRASSNESSNTNNTNTQSNSNADTPQDTANNTNQSPTSTEQCRRSVTNNIMEEQINIKNQFVTLNVEGYGNIKIQLYDQDAPKTVENFLRLTKSGYYDCITFHRIAKGFVIQGGDPTGTGSGGESAFGGEFADELNPNTPSAKAGYAKGVVAMANRGPNTNTSQFFIMLDNNQLPFAYTIFGKVVEGIDVVDKIGQAPITPQMGPTDGAPVSKITITKATISDK
jgi:cyclophilin family peptidyl-prolyl cis-trans isomerase